jgi:hypothetical protein
LNRQKRRIRHGIRQEQKNTPAQDRIGSNSAGRAKNGGNQAEKSFDFLTEGLLWKDSRGDKTAIELFMAGVQVLDATIRGVLCQCAMGLDRS